MARRLRAKEGNTILSIKGQLFIDANQYLDLYQMIDAKKILVRLEEQQKYIFVTRQIVDEVYRGKVRVASWFLAEQLKNWEAKWGGITFPDHLLNTTDKRLASKYKKLREISNKDTKEFKKLTYDLLEQVSQSKDEISRRLAGIFAEAVPHNGKELQQARERREHGNPPGKGTDPLGDQLNWEQLLSQLQSNRGLWIISRDSDFATKHEGERFLNAALYKNLATRLHPAEPEVFCFDNLSDGLTHFVKRNRVRATKLTPEEAERLKKEQESLPIVDWANYDDSASYLVVRARADREAAQMRVAAMSQFASEQVFPPAISETDKDGT